MILLVFGSLSLPVMLFKQVVNGFWIANSVIQMLKACKTLAEFDLKERRRKQ